MNNKYNILSSTSGSKTFNSMLFSGNGIGSYNRIRNYKTPISNNNTINLTYYINLIDFVENTITIPTKNYSNESTNVSSYFGGRATVYNSNNEMCGTCGATFLNIQNSSNIYTEISNYLTIDNGLIISWFTPSNPANLEIDTIVNSMVTECIVKSTTKIGSNPYYGMTFNMIVSSNNGVITFSLTSVSN
jgi:hypothetical protein